MSGREKFDGRDHARADHRGQRWGSVARTQRRWFWYVCMPELTNSPARIHVHATSVLIFAPQAGRGNLRVSKHEHSCCPPAHNCRDIHALTFHMPRERLRLLKATSEAVTGSWSQLQRRFPRHLFLSISRPYLPVRINFSVGMSTAVIVLITCRAPP